MKKTTFTGGNRSRKWSVAQRLSAKRQAEIFDLFVGLRFSELKKLIQSLHPLEELIATTNLVAGCTTMDKDFLIKITREVVEGYMSEELSFEELKTYTRNFSDDIFELAEEQGVKPDTVFYKEKNEPVYLENTVRMVVE